MPLQSYPLVTVDNPWMRVAQGVNCMVRLTQGRKAIAWIKR